MSLCCLGLRGGGCFALGLLRLTSHKKKLCITCISSVANNSHRSLSLHEANRAIGYISFLAVFTSMATIQGHRMS